MKAKNAEWINKYPAIQDLEKRAQNRIPNVAWQYLQSGTGDEFAVERNLSAFEKIQMHPRFMKGELSPDLSVELMGKSYNSPFGIAPVGLSGLMWPGAEFALAKTAVKYNIPYCLSTVATQTPETVGPYVGEQGWFQLYTPRKKEIRRNLIQRAKNSGFQTLMVTADVPEPSRRERTKRAGLRTPPKISPSFVFDALTNPAWTKRMVKYGIPKLRTILQYAEENQAVNVFEELRSGFGGTLSWDYLKELRDEWDGKLILKGLTHPGDAEMALKCGVDAIGVSNHGGRQFDAVPAAIDCLEDIVAVAKGKVAILYDSGVRSGLDVIKALHLGADFVFLGRPFFYGLAALGDLGGDHVCDILREDIRVNMLQLGIEKLSF